MLYIDTPASLRKFCHNKKSIESTETFESQGHLFLLCMQSKSVFGPFFFNE